MSFVQSAIAPESGEVLDTKQCLKTRSVLGIMGFLGFAIVYAMRVNLSVAIVAMVNSSAVITDNTTIDVCENIKPINNSTVPERDGEFDWDEKQQGIVLGAFFYGYVITQIPGGRLSEMFGSKIVYGLGVFFTSIFTILSPLAAYQGYPYFIAIRVLEGLCEGVTFPSMHAMLARWIPPNERSLFSGLIYAGSNFGSIVSFPVSAWLCTLDYANGWPLCFYLFGALGIVWCVLWYFLIFDTPLNHPRITLQEKDYIIRTIGPCMESRPKSVPWSHLLSSVPLWAILVTHCGISWQFYTQLTELPTYMNNILHFKLEENALLSALPYLTAWITSVAICAFANWLITKDYISQVNSYRLWNTVSTFIPSMGLLGVAWVGCDQLAVVILLAATGAFSGAYYAGYQMNHIVLSPQYAGTMYGITNSAANLCGFLAPYLVGTLIEGKETLSQWRMVFYIAAAINLSCNLFYIMFVSGEEEEWSVNISRQQHQQDHDIDSSYAILEDSLSSQYHNETHVVL